MKRVTPFEQRPHEQSFATSLGMLNGYTESRFLLLSLADARALEYLAQPLIPSLLGADSVTT